MASQTDFYSFKHGMFAVTVLSDGPILLNGELFAPEATDAERAVVVARLNGSDNMAHAQSNIPLIVTEDDVILIDVGAGNRFQPTEGRLEENLKSAGYSAEDVTIVIISHAHPDHIWGLLRENGELRFPKARHFVGREEWDFWMGDAASALPAEVQPFVEGARRDLNAIADRVTFLNDGDEIVPGLMVIATPGHTAGHLSFQLNADLPLIVTVDAVASDVVAFEKPEWSFGFDMDPDRARVTRRALLDRAVRDNATLLGFHWIYPGVGTVRKDGEAYAFTSAAGDRS